MLLTINYWTDHHKHVSQNRFRMYSRLIFFMFDQMIGFEIIMMHVKLFGKNRDDERININPLTAQPYSFLTTLFSSHP